MTVRSNCLLGAGTTLLARDLVLGAALKCLPHFILDQVLQVRIRSFGIQPFRTKHGIRELSYKLRRVLAEPRSPERR